LKSLETILARAIPPPDATRALRRPLFPAGGPNRRKLNSGFAPDGLTS
jgi:hypothetical protein